MATQNTPTRGRLVKRTEVEALTALSTSTIYRFIAEGSFPKQVKLGDRAVAWLESDIVAWIEQRAAARSKK